MSDPAKVFAASYAKLEGERDALRRERDTLRAAIWAALAMSDRPAQAAGILRSAIPDDYRPLGA